MFSFCVRSGVAYFAAFLVCLVSATNACAHMPDESGHGFYTALDVLGQDTVHLYAREYGHGRPVLLLHGLAASSYSWRKIIPRLAKTNRVIAIDLKGFGRSQKPFDLAYRPGDHARLVEAFIRKRNLHDLTLVGHSFGGAIALITALRFNNKDRSTIRDLVIISAPAYRQPRTEFVKLLHTPVLPYAVFTLVPPELATWMSLTETERRVATVADVREYARPYYEPGARHALIVTSRQIIPHDVDRLTSLYPTIRQKTLVVWCDEDDVVLLEKGRKLERELPRARLEVLRGCGHAIPDERPKQLSHILSRFITR